MGSRFFWGVMLALFALSRFSFGAPDVGRVAAEGKGTVEFEGNRIKALAADLDIDWMALAYELERSGTEKGEIYEALLARFILMADRDSLVALYARLDREGVELPFGEGRLFAGEVQRDGFLSGLAALQAAQWRDIEALRELAKEAYLKSPSAFALLELEDELEDVQGLFSSVEEMPILPLESKLLQRSGKSVAIGELLDGRKGLYLDFWASWCGPCIRAMPELKERAASYEPQGLVVVGVNTDSTDAKQHTKDMAKRFSMTMPWLIEPDEEPFSVPLNIRTIPRVVVIDPEGRVRFNGHPDDMELKLALIELGVLPLESPKS